MFIEMRNDRSGLQHLIAIDSTESIQLEHTRDEHTRDPVFLLVATPQNRQIVRIRKISKRW